MYRYLKLIKDFFFGDLAYFYAARYSLKADLAWQPLLYTAVFWGVVATLVFGDHAVIPPVDGLDAGWIYSGLLSPILGFVAVVMLKCGSGRHKYQAFWMRMAGNVGVATAIVSYNIESLQSHEFHPIPLAITTSSAWFLIVLIARDLRFIAMTERLASALRDG